MDTLFLWLQCIVPAIHNVLSKSCLRPYVMFLSRGFYLTVAEGCVCGGEAGIKGLHTTMDKNVMKV